MRAKGDSNGFGTPAGIFISARRKTEVAKKRGKKKGGQFEATAPSMTASPKGEGGGSRGGRWASEMKAGGECSVKTTGRSMFGVILPNRARRGLSPERLFFQRNRGSEIKGGAGELQTKLHRQSLSARKDSRSRKRTRESSGVGDVASAFDNKKPWGEVRQGPTAPQPCAMLTSVDEIGGG